MNKIIIARSEGGHSNIVLSPWEITQDSLAKELSNPVIGQKDGSYYIRCAGTYRDNAHTADTADILILDCDKRIIENGELVDGATNPDDVYSVLAKLGVCFVLYSSFSNGATRAELAAKVKPGKPEPDTGGAYGKDFHKYRVLIFCTYSREQLPALLDTLFKELHQAGVMLADVKEQHTWSQPWYFPRVPDAHRRQLFKFKAHTGNKELDVDGIYSVWKAEQDKLRAASTHRASVLMGQGKTALDACNESFSIQQLMPTYGFVKAGKKYISPHSESGNAQFLVNGKKWTSFHGSDAEAGLGNAGNNGERFGDAFDLFCFFEHRNDRRAALIAAGDMFRTSDGETVNKKQQIDYRVKQGNQSQDNSQQQESATGADMEQNNKEHPKGFSDRWADADDLADNAKAPEYLINDILESNSHGMMGGASQSLKTFMALKMAHSICTGTDFFGNQVFKTGKVLYVCGEGKGALDRRIKALGIAESSFNGNLKVLKVSLHLDNTANMVEITADIKALNPVLVIFDTFSSLTVNADENSNSDVSGVVSRIQESCNGDGASTLLIHHYGKDATKGLRGASAFFNNVDYMYEMSRIEESMLTTMTCKKMKDGEIFPPFNAQAVVVDIGLTRQDGKSATSLVLKMPDADSYYCKPSEHFKFAKNEEEVYDACLFVLSNLPEYCPETVRELFADSPQKAPKKVFKKDNIADHAYKLMQADKSNRSSRLERALLGLTKKFKLGFYNGFYWIID